MLSAVYGEEGRSAPEKKALGARLLGSVAAAVGAILGCGGGGGAPGRV